MVRVFSIALILSTFSGCAALRVRVVDETTGLPIPGKKVSATPLGIFPLGIPSQDSVTTGEDGIAVLRNRRIDSSIISVDGVYNSFGYEEVVNGSDRLSDDSIRVENAGHTLGWPFRRR